MKSQIDRLEAAYQANEEMPILSVSEFEQLLIEVQTSDLGDYEKQDVANYLYKGRGLGVDTNL